MDEMVNAATSLFPLLTLRENNSLYLNTSIIFFSIISSSNHVIPENLDGLTHIVKMLFSNLLFSLTGINPFLGFIISLVDLIPLLTENKKYKNIGEKLLQIPRQTLEIYLVGKLYEKNLVDIGIILLSKVIYYFERQSRIKAGHRNEFPMIHSAEHFGIFLLLKNYTNSKPEYYEYLMVFILTQVALAIFIYLFNVYINLTFMSRIPKWFENDKHLIEVLRDKIQKNLRSKKLHNYVVKPMLLHLKLRVVTWNDIEIYCDEIIKKLNLDEIDIIIGIKTGGYFVGKYIAWKTNKKFAFINSKLWSGISMTKTLGQSYQFYKGENFSPNITDIPDVEGKRILVCDDTSYTGMTMTNVCEKLRKEGKPKDLKTLCIWIFGEFHPDYYVRIMRVPLLWEWGSEVD